MASRSSHVQNIVRNMELYEKKTRHLGHARGFHRVLEAKCHSIFVGALQKEWANLPARSVLCELWYALARTCDASPSMFWKPAEDKLPRAQIVEQ